MEREPEMRGGSQRFDSGRAHPYTRGVDNPILRAFLDALQMVFTETGIEIESIEDEEQDERDDQFITSVGLLGGIRGIFMLRSNDACASLLLRRMLGDIPVSKEAGNLTEIQMAALGEL